MRSRLPPAQNKERYVRRTSEPSSEISGMDEPSITECTRQEMEVSSKIEDKMDAMMMRIEQGMRMNDKANKSRCEAMQSSVNNRMESLCTIIEAKMIEVNDTI